MKKILPVSTNDKFAYNIMICHNFENLIENIITIKSEKSRKICIVTDENVEKLYAETIRGILSDYYSEVLIYAVPAGEQFKNLETVSRLYEYLINAHFDRKDLLAALGGGVVGDMTGFVAATYLRGIDFVQIPTTLLSQVDSSVGGKTGVDFLHYKNMVGAFYMPKLVYINTEVLGSLPKEQFASGMAEVIKYGLIQRADFFGQLSEEKEAIRAMQPEVLADIIYTSCACKREVVEEDPTEQGIRAILNFGHTAGHAIEKMSDFSLFHGQCVAIGMVAAALLSQKRGYLSEEEVRRIRELIADYDLPVSASGMSVEEVLMATKSDKKMSGGHIRFILLKEIGKAVIDEQVTDEELREVIGEVVD